MGKGKILTRVSEKCGDGEGPASYVSSDTLRYINLAG